MGFLEKLVVKGMDALEKNREEIFKYMREYKNYPVSKLEEIRDDKSKSLQRRAAANNLLNGDFLDVLD
jgi:hypothetical protein